MADTDTTTPPPTTNASPFYLTDPSSEPSTRASTPDVEETGHANGYGYPPEKSTGQVLDGPRLPDDVYESALSWCGAGIRKMLGRNLKKESSWIAAMQTRVRTAWLDAYFVYTSTLGTHTFFMTLLPAVFFFGHDRTGRGLVIVLGMGVYWSSFVKDLICSPRPYAPPVTRLSVGNHHLEYGFPSTHSTNSVSIAFYIHSLLYRLYLSGAMSSTTLHLFQAAIVWYTFSIVFGRLYCGMHSFSDCSVGVAMGAVVWASYWATEDIIERWISTSGWSVPVTLVSLAILMINQHPQPIDDCPCFEDSIAFVSSILGVLLGEWHAIQFGLLQGNTSSDGGELKNWSIWLSFAALKLFFGILSIFVWRLVAKAFFHAVLPPIFRFAALIFTLPTRRFYTPATDYERVPAERGLHPIPSVISLPLSPSASSQALPRFGSEGLKSRIGGGAKAPDNDLPEKGAVNVSFDDLDHSDEREGRKHYDADVLTKAMVYVGIGMIASEWGPVVFQFLGWSGVRR